MFVKVNDIHASIYCMFCSAKESGSLQLLTRPVRICTIGFLCVDCGADFFIAGSSFTHCIFPTAAPAVLWRRHSTGSSTAKGNKVGWLWYDLCCTQNDTPSENECCSFILLFSPNKTITFCLLRRYTSSVHYDSHRHFIQDVALQPWGQGLEHCRQTIMAIPHSTWRHYKTQLEFQPRHRPQRFKSTTIIYPKKTSEVYTTELNYDCHRLSRRFLSSVELETTGPRKLPQWEGAQVAGDTQGQSSTYPLYCGSPKAGCHWPGVLLFFFFF